MLLFLVLPAGLPQIGKLLVITHSSQAKNQVFHPTGATRCIDSRQIWFSRQAPGSAWLCNISHQSAASVFVINTVYCLFIKKISKGSGAPVFVEGGGAPVPWHNGIMASPSLFQGHDIFRH